MYDLSAVDLGYEIHHAFFLNQTGNFYNFSNIRYATPPTGQNRFRAPQPPAVNRSVIRDSTQGVICPAAEPQWLQLAAQFLPDYLEGRPSNLTHNDFVMLNSSLTPSTVPAQGSRTTEDCLFWTLLYQRPYLIKRIIPNLLLY